MLNRSASPKPKRITSDEYDDTSDPFEPLQPYRSAVLRAEDLEVLVVGSEDGAGDSDDDAVGGFAQNEERE